MSAVRKINILGVALALMLTLGYAQAVYGISPAEHLYAIASTDDRIINKNKPRTAKQQRRGAAKLYKFKPKEKLKADVEISLPADI